MLTSTGAASAVDHWPQTLDEERRWLVVHSFNLQGDEEQAAILRPQHGYEFDAGVRAGNVVGYQFRQQKNYDLQKGLASSSPGSLRDG